MSHLKSLTVIITITLVFGITHTIASLYDDSRAVVVSGGENHTLVLTADGFAWACGENGLYQLGVDDTTDRPLLVRVHDGNMVTDSNYLENIIDIDAGWKHSLAVDVNNHVWA